MIKNHSGRNTLVQQCKNIGFVRTVMKIFSSQLLNVSRTKINVNWAVKTSSTDETKNKKIFEYFFSSSIQRWQSNIQIDIVNDQS